MGAISKEMKEMVLREVTIPEYFNEIILNDMPEFYSDYTVDFEARPVVKCPLHGENTPSLRYYEDTNTFYCFGCRVGGDIIKLHMEYMDKCVGEATNFPSAVEFLHRRFIQGRNIVKVPKKNYVRHIINIENSSTTVELVKYNRYLEELELKLSRDRSMNIDIKSDLYIYIEEIKIMVANSILNAIKAIDMLKSRYNEAINKS